MSVDAPDTAPASIVLGGSCFEGDPRPPRERPVCASVAVAGIDESKYPNRDVDENVKERNCIDSVKSAYIKQRKSYYWDESVLKLDNAGMAGRVRAWHPCYIHSPPIFFFFAAAVRGNDQNNCTVA